jgi:penicillin-binding protein 1A
MDKKKVKKYLRILIIFLFIALIACFASLFLFVKKNSQNLPDYEKLRDYTPSITTRLYASDGALVSEYSKEKRVFVPIELIPDNLKNAFIAAEDSNFYQNSGIDPFAIFRTAIKNVLSFLRGEESLGGASTITQQVVKNFLLTRDRTFTRKLKEAILAYKMTKSFPKDKILELYLNQIYLGSGAYGVAAASQVYFNKSIEDLTIEEVALLATLPKAPSKLDPRKNIEKAKIRRNWVINRMLEEGFIKQSEAEEAKEKEIILNSTKEEGDFTQANFFADSVKKELSKVYGSDSVFEDGIFVRTTLDSKLQKIANTAFQRGIEDYDMRHGYRGALGKIKMKGKDKEEINKELKDFAIKDLYKSSWQKAVIVSLDAEFAEIMLENSLEGKISLEDIKWARRYINTNKIGGEIKKPSYVFKIGDIILVEKKDEEGAYYLRQIPDINGAFLAMDPHTGRILAMMGGYIDLPNQFNRATQALRQPGSTMKTFGYLAALENGMTPATIIVDEPITLNQGDDLPPYNPTNYSGQFYGPTTLRRGLEKSQNVTTVRMADEIGLDKVVEVVKRLGINDDPQYIHSLVLGSTETTLTKLITAYAMMINGGKKITPALIEKIQDRDGATIYRRDESQCDECKIKSDDETVMLPVLPDSREVVVDEATSYQISYMLQGVVERGTAYRARSVGKVLGGKTGTTNNSYDSWFVGFSPDLIVAVYVGFDSPKNMGDHETGSSVAMPIFIDFMKDALKDVPSTPFRVPSSVKFVKIDRMVGKYATPSTPKENIFFEAFKVSDDVDSILSESFFDSGSSDHKNSDDEFKMSDPTDGIY